MNKVVSSFEKNKFEEIRVGVKEYKGYDLIDLRIWTQVAGQPEKVPTSKGLSMNVSLFNELKSGILKLEQVLRDNKLLME